MLSGPKLLAKGESSQDLVPSVLVFPRPSPVVLT